MAIYVHNSISKDPLFGFHNLQAKFEALEYIIITTFFLSSWKTVLTFTAESSHIPISIIEKPTIQVLPMVSSNNNIPYTVCVKSFPQRKMRKNTSVKRHELRLHVIDKLYWIGWFQDSIIHSIFLGPDSSLFRLI